METFLEFDFTLFESQWKWCIAVISISCIHICTIFYQNLYNIQIPCFFFKFAILSNFIQFYFHIILLIPLLTATCNGVVPNLFAWLIAAPFLMRRSAIFVLPEQ